MNSLALLDAMCAIDDKYLISAQARIGCGFEMLDQNCNKKYNNRLRRSMICIAAVIALLIVSFTVAIAASGSIQEFVFSIFNISTTEVLPKNTKDTVLEGDVELINKSDIDGNVNTYYFKGNGVIAVYDGIIYSGEYKNGERSFYDMDSNGLVTIPTTRVEFPCRFRGTDFNIKFDYCVYNGVMHYHEIPENLNENPYKYGWFMGRVGSNPSMSFLFLPYEAFDGYGVYPLLFNIETKETIDIIEGMPLDEITPIQWVFSDNISNAIMTGFTRDHKTDFWICDVEGKTLKPLSELTHRTIIGCSVIDWRHIICYAANESGFDVISFDPENNTVKMLVEGTEYYEKDGNNSGFCNIQYNGGYGRHALLISENGSITLIDLFTGKKTPLDGLKANGSLLTSESPDGEHILFAFRDAILSDSFAIYKIGVLDCHTGVLKILKRSNYELRNETLMGWLDNNCITILAYDEIENNGWYMFVYDYR